MASVVARQLFPSPKNFRLLPHTFSVPSRQTSVPPPRKIVRGTVKHRHLIASDCQSLADRGFLRFQKPYKPLADAADKVTAVVQKILGSAVAPSDEVPKSKKSQILRECWKEFNHSVPNSQLHKIIIIDDITKFYMTPVDTKTPYDKLLGMELPPNLHVQKDYLRFHPDEDTRFDGISAYPRSPTIVTGIRSRKKYKGYNTQLPYTYFNEAFYRKI